MHKTIALVSIMFATSACFAYQPKLSNVQLGSIVGKDVAICKADTRSGLSDNTSEYGEECLEKMPEYDLVEGLAKYRALNANYAFFGKLRTVDTFQQRVWRAQFELGKRFTEKSTDPHDYVKSLTTALEAKTGIEPKVSHEYNYCNKGTPPSECWISIKKIWVTKDARYTLDYSKRTDSGLITFETLVQPYIKK